MEKMDGRTYTGRPDLHRTDGRTYYIGRTDGRTSELALDGRTD